MLLFLRRIQDAYYEAVSPIMLDALLRYIAGSLNQRAVLNSSISPTNPDRRFEHYPTASQIDWLQVLPAS
jgi:hypothetical protein